MESSTGPVEALFEKGETYIKTSLELAKLKSIETSTEIGTILFAKIGAILMFTLFILVMNIGVALWVGELLGKVYFGFFVVAGFYLIVGIIFHFTLQQWIRDPLSRLIIKKTLHSTSGN